MKATQSLSILALVALAAGCSGERSQPSVAHEASASPHADDQDLSEVVGADAAYIIEILQKAGVKGVRQFERIVYPVTTVRCRFDVTLCTVTVDGESRDLTEELSAGMIETLEGASGWRSANGLSCREALSPHAAERFACSFVGVPTEG